MDAGCARGKPTSRSFPSEGDCDESHEPEPDREDPMTRFRRASVWIVVALLVFTLVATLILEGIA